MPLPTVLPPAAKTAPTSREIPRSQLPRMELCGASYGRLPVRNESDLAGLDPGGHGAWGDQGFYYDDFSARSSYCRSRWPNKTRGGYTFTPFATPMSGVTVSLHCHKLDNRDQPGAEEACRF